MDLSFAIFLSDQRYSHPKLPTWLRHGNIWMIEQPVFLPDIRQPDARRFDGGTRFLVEVVLHGQVTIICGFDNNPDGVVPAHYIVLDGILHQ